MFLKMLIWLSGEGSSDEEGGVDFEEAEIDDICGSYRLERPRPRADSQDLQNRLDRITCLLLLLFFSIYRLISLARPYHASCPALFPALHALGTGSTVPSSLIL